MKPKEAVIQQRALDAHTIFKAALIPAQTHNNPFFTTMLFAWSLTEVVRYSFYVTSLLGIDIPVLNYLR